MIAVMILHRSLCATDGCNRPFSSDVTFVLSICLSFPGSSPAFCFFFHCQLCRFRHACKFDHSNESSIPVIQTHWSKRKKHERERERESKSWGFDFVFYNFSFCLFLGKATPVMHYACASSLVAYEFNRTVYVYMLNISWW
jgi:hypothetical protein